MKRISNGPIYQNIQEHLQGLLDDGTLNPGDQLPSERTLMSQFETSNMPVRQAIQHFIDKGIFERVHGRGTFVCHQAKRTGRVAVLYVYDNAGMWASPFFTEIMRGIEDITLENDQRLLMQSVADSDIYALMCRLEDEVDGFILLDLFPSMVERVEKYVRGKRKPLVLVNYPCSGQNIDTVLTDNIQNAQLLTQHLIKLGHRRIAFLFQYSTMGKMRELHPSYPLKQLGYRQALELNDIPFDKELCINVSKDVDLSADIKDKHITAIFCSGSHLVDRHVLPAIETAGLRVPQDISIVTYDRTRDIEDTKMPITTINTPLVELGQTTTRRLNEKIQSKAQSCSSILLQGQVLRGQSDLPLKG